MLRKLAVLAAVSASLYVAGYAAGPQAASPKALFASNWPAIRGEYDRYRQAAFPVGGGHRARNYGQEWVTRFDGRGFDITPDAAGWRWGLELQSYGFPGQEHRVNGARAQADVERLSYQWDSTINEWFVNGTAGLEHGFTLASRPGNSSLALTLHLTIRGALTPHISPNGRWVSFLDDRGVAALTYSGLNVTDAQGRKLGAHFMSEPQGLRLEVDDSSARYPIIIDPIAQQAYLKPAAVGTSQAGHNFGWSVAVSGDTMVVGAPQEASSSTGINSTPDESATGAGAAYVFTRTAGVWSQEAYLKPAAVGTSQAGDHFGWSVALSGDTLVVGAPHEDSSSTGLNSTPNEEATGAGAAYVFTRTDGVWSQKAYLKPEALGTTQVGDQFGYSVAVSGDMIVVGAYGESSSTLGVNSAPNRGARGAGAAYVFMRSVDGWSQQAYLKPASVATTQGNHHFGSSVAVSGDTVVVGALGESSSSLGVNSTPNNEASGAGAAYVFARSMDGWSQEAYLKPAVVGTTQANDHFGSSVAVSGDTVVVGAHGESSSSLGINSSPNERAASAGAAYVFTRNAEGWNQEAYLKPAAVGNSQTGHFFGWSVAVSGDTLVVGAIGEASSTTDIDSTPNEAVRSAGAAYLFARSFGVWSQQAYLKPAVVGTTQANHQFGFSVAVSGDAVLVGASGEASSSLGVNSTPNEGAAGAGAAYVYSIPPPAPALSIKSTHRGYFIRGQMGATYSVTVSNAAGAGPTIGTVELTSGLPPGLTLVSMAGKGWTCDRGGVCTRFDPLNGGSSYDVVTVTANVAANTPGTVIHRVSVSGGGSPGAGALDLTGVGTVCDINVDGTVDVKDVQAIVNEVLGITTPATHDLNHDGVVNVADVQEVINGALGMTCPAVPAPIVLQSGVIVGVGGSAAFAVTLPFAAPAGGVTVTLSSSDPTTVTVPASVLIAAGQTTPASQPLVSGIKVGSASVSASAPGYITSSQTVTVVATSITVSSTSVGQNLQAPITITLSPPVSGAALNVTLASSDVTKLILGRLLAAGSTDPAHPTVLGFPVGATSGVAYAQALAGSGTVTVTVSAPGYPSGTATVTLTPSAFVIAGPTGVVGIPSFPTNVGNTTTLTVMTGRLNASNNYIENQGLRAGFTAAVSLTSLPVTVGQVSPGSITFGSADTSFTTTFTALGVGTALVTAVEPAGFSTPAGGANSITANVAAGGITAPNVTVGKSLEVAAQVAVTGAPSVDTVLTLTSSDPNRLRFGVSPTDPGVGTIPIPSCIPPVPDPTNACKIVKVAHGQSHSSDIYFQALDSAGSVTYTATLPGFGSKTGTVSFTPSGILIVGPNGLGADVRTVTLSAPTQLTVESARLDSLQNFAELQLVAPITGVPPVSINVTSSSPAVGTISSSPVSIPAGSNFVTDNFNPVAAGTTTISVNVPTGFSAPAAGGSLPATVSTAGIGILSSGPASIGKFLQIQDLFTLGAPAPPGTIVTITSNNPSLLSLSTSQTAAGMTTITIPMSPGGSSGTYYIQALAGSGTATFTASAPGYASRTGSVTLTPSGVALGDGSGNPIFGNPIAVSLAQLDLSHAFVQIQQLAGGLSPVTVNLSATVGSITPSVTINAGASSVNATITGSGTATVTATNPPGFGPPASVQVTVFIF